MRSGRSWRTIAEEGRPSEDVVQHRHHRPHHCPERGEPLDVTITVLGGFGVTVDGVPTAGRGWARRSAAALVKILALAPGHRLHRETLMDLLWPDESPITSAPRLHKAAHFARRAAGRHDAVVLRDDLVWLFPCADVTVDAVRFEQLARLAVADDDPGVAREALDWYRGELLPGDRYEDWASDRRELLHLRRLDVLRVAGEWRELAEVDPIDEEAHMELMRRQVAAGDAGAALRQFEHLERVLERDLGVRPGEAARGVLHEARLLRGGEHVSTPTSSSRVDALLAELAALVRRESAVLAELAAVGAAPPAFVPLAAAG
jgi:DNA-binding SARP family transcriptional activator